MSVDNRGKTLNFQSRLRLDGKVALVIGAGGFGMGTPTSLALAEAGATVVCVDQSEAVVDEITGRIRESGAGSVKGIVANVAHPADVDRAIDETLAELGRIDLLVNVVGGTRRHWHRVDAFPLEGFDETFVLNVRYAFQAAGRVARHMIERGGGGAIVNFSSASARTSAPYHSAYGAAKAAIDSLTRSMAVEWAQFGIRVNAVAPGSVRTPSTGRIALDMGDEAVARWLDADEIAGAILFLLSDLGSGVSGQVLSVDGGLSSRSVLATSGALADSAKAISEL